MPGSSPGMTGGVSPAEVKECFAQTQNSIFKQQKQFQTHVHNLAARCARAVHLSSAQGGHGECRAPVAPAVSCALGSGRTHTSNNEYTGIARHSRTQWFYGVCRALPGDRALLPPSPADMSCLSPVGPTQLRRLDTSVGVSGPHDFAVRNNISRQHAGDRSKVFRPALQSHRAQNAAASTATHPAFVTIMIRPLWGGMRKVLDLIWGEWEQEYFSENQK